MSYIIYDIVILIILVLFAIHGLKRGLVRSLFSFLAVLVALVGALIVSNQFSPAVSEWLHPLVEPAVTSAVESALPEDSAQVELPIDQLLPLLQDTELPLGLNKLLDAFAQEDTEPTLAGGLSVHLTAMVASAIASIGLFLIAFILILILWHLLSRTLDLVTHLPGLNFLNKLGGLVFGVLRGAIVLFVCAWLIRWLWSDLLPGQIIEQSKLIHFFMTVNPMDYLAKLDFENLTTGS